MYYPYFRGKQFELIAIRESAELIAQANFVPIIEPVRESLSGLKKALESLIKANAQATVVINPQYGDYKNNPQPLIEFLEEVDPDNKFINVGIFLSNHMVTSQVTQLIEGIGINQVSLIHGGFTDSSGLSNALALNEVSYTHIFLDDKVNRLYQNRFNTHPRVLIQDGFKREKNADYPKFSAFSDLHITYEMSDMNGFGDFLIVGDNYSEGGGPAYAVAIHMSYIDPDQDSAMFVHHFKSDTNDTPTDPAGKFQQALAKLIKSLDRGDSHLLETTAVKELRELHSRQHFPGLGYVKKLSIKHHLETLADYQAVK